MANYACEHHHGWNMQTAWTKIDPSFNLCIWWVYPHLHKTDIIEGPCYQIYYGTEV